MVTQALVFQAMLAAEIIDVAGFHMGTARAIAGNPGTTGIFHALSFAPHAHFMQEVIDLFFNALELSWGGLAINHERETTDFLDWKLALANPFIDGIARALVLFCIRGDSQEHSVFK